MAELHLRGRIPNSVFGLHRDKENDATLALGWTLSKSETFLAALLKTFDLPTDGIDKASIRLQEYGGGSGEGITDIEVEIPGEIFLIIEAKIGWVVPGTQQLLKYAARDSYKNSKARKKVIAILSECTDAYANRELAGKDLGGLPVLTVSWHAIDKLTKQSIKAARSQEKLYLSELDKFLHAIMKIQDRESNMVFVVALTRSHESFEKYGPVDVVEKFKIYYHPAAAHWPKEPPNYIAFRYDGRLQSIHHIESYQVAKSLKGIIPGNEFDKPIPHFVYNLGPTIGPSHRVATGNMYGPAHAWCMLDTLLTEKTVWDAQKKTAERKKVA
jgi:hypothetical protein